MPDATAFVKVKEDVFLGIFFSHGPTIFGVDIFSEIVSCSRGFSRWSSPVPSSDFFEGQIQIRLEDMQLSMEGGLLITGPQARKVRQLLLKHPSFYTRYIVPYIQAQESSFTPDEFWIDSRGRIHITNRKIIRRMSLTMVRKIRSLRS